MFDFTLHHTELHGHRVAYRKVGEGPVILLLHGITSNSANWTGVAERLCDRYTLIAPDLLGHGRSAKPRGDYSMGAFAAGVRDLGGKLGVESATVVGHSLGGGVAMQFAYLFPEFCERLALVSSGGLGREVSPLLRAATLPGSELVLPLIAHTRITGASRWIGKQLDRVGIDLGVDVREVSRGHVSLEDPEARSAFVQTLRASIDATGQRVSALDRLYLANEIPFLIVWGARDPIIPVSHGRRAADLVPNSRLEIFERARHFPHLDQPDQFVEVMEDWIETTRPASLTIDDWREALGGERREQSAPAAEAV